MRQKVQIQFSIFETDLVGHQLAAVHRMVAGDQDDAVIGSAHWLR